PSSAGDRAAPARAAPRRFRRRDPGPARDRGAAFRRARAAGRGGTGLGDAQARAQGPGGEPRGGTMTVRAVLIGALSLPRRLVALPVRAYQVGISPRSEEHTSELQSRFDLVCRLLLEKKTMIY